MKYRTSVCVQVVEDKMSGKVHNYKENEKMSNKTVIAVLSMVMIFVLAACGKTNEWVGTYGGTSTSGHKVEITINDDGTVQYKRGKDITAGTWTEKEHSILLDFNGEVSSTSEPLIVTLSADKTTITVESDDSKWHPDYYQRR